MTLDEQIAGKVMGWTRLTGEEAVTDHRVPFEHQHREAIWMKNGSRMGCRECGDLPQFSTDIAAAWQVVEALGDKCFFLFEDRYGGTWAREQFPECGDYVAYFGIGPETVVNCLWATDGQEAVDAWKWMMENWFAIACAQTVPMAICLAALKVQR